MGCFKQNLVSLIDKQDFKFIVQHFWYQDPLLDGLKPVSNFKNCKNCQ